MTMDDIDLHKYKASKNLSKKRFASEEFFQGDNEVKFWTQLRQCHVLLYVIFYLLANKAGASSDTANLFFRKIFILPRNT